MKKENDVAPTVSALLKDIQEAIGDRSGELTKDELINHCKNLHYAKQFYQRRCDLLQKEQRRMRDPERTLVCDILANGTLLPDPNGMRYGTVES